MKKILLLGLSLALMFSLAACGKSEAATAVDEQIAAIGEVTLESADAVDAAQAALDALSDADAAKVSNADVLTAAAEQLKALRQAQVDSLLAGMRLEEDKVRGIRFYNPKGWVYYDSNTWAADQRCFILPYLGQDSTHTWLRLVLNYTGDDWVFFKQILMNIDGEQHQKSFSYFDVVRDNSGGRVWEYIDLDVSNDSDVEWLWSIANSAETYRNTAHALIDERTVWEIYLKVFQYALTVHQPDSMMTSYNPCNGAWCAGDPELLMGILRGEWGYQGYVMTDWGSTDRCDAVTTAEAGNSWIAPGEMDDRETAPMVKAMADGILERERVRKNVYRMMQSLIRY